MYRSYIKRLIDFVLSLIGLICLSPLILLVILCLFVANKGTNVFFLQSRPGYKGKIFRVIKFRTMTDERDTDGNLLPDEKRITKVGRFVRSTSIDELLQLVNVLKGDMALVGPRPLLVDFRPLYNNEQMRRHDVRPGITGWAQVNGRNTMKYSKKFEYDVWYVDHLSLWIDIKIIWMTIMNVLQRKDIGEDMYDETDDLGWNKYINKKL